MREARRVSCGISPTINSIPGTTRTHNMASQNFMVLLYQLRQVIYSNETRCGDICTQLIILCML
jgi:hypothetical protein